MKNLFDRINIRFLAIAPFVLALANLAFYSSLIDRGILPDPGGRTSYLAAALSCFMAGFSGIFQLLRNEYLGIVGQISDGTIYRIESILLVAMCWSGSIFFLFASLGIVDVARLLPVRQ